MSIYDAAMKYQAERAARRLRRPGVRHRQLARLGGQGHAAARRARVVAAELRAHPPQNLVGMGVLPLQFKEGVSAQTLGLDGTETFDGVDPMG